ncbi:MAG TPA: murein biosynthesis integral membrane protein MurJ [Acidimicrobiales bacterium]|nr:murein biosynthesis integral membrane protein MurJ [Acidimicrobiales bacterium]
MNAGDAAPDPPADQTSREPAEPAPSGRRASALVASGIMLSRLAGLVRERVIASELGVGMAVDAFRAALRIPNLMQNLLGEGVLSASFIPVYARLLEEGREEEAGKVAGAIAGLLAAVAGLLVLIGVVFARPITLALAPGFAGTPERLELTVTLTRILTPGIGILVLSAWCLGVLNSHRRFFLSYVAPVLWNAAQIGVLVALGMRGFSQEGLAIGLAWGAFAGGVLQLLVQVPTVVRLVRHLRPSLRTDLPGVRTIVRRFVPVVLGRGVVQLSAYLDLLLASLLAVGAVSALGYAQVFYLLPISLFGMSVAAAELPELSRLDAPTEEALATWQERVESGLARVAFFVVPVSMVYLVLGDLVVGALLRTGRFGLAETVLVWYVLAAFTIGLLATTSSRLLQSTLYALGDTRTPARVAALRVALAAGLGVVLMFQLDRIVLDGTGLVGLAGFDELPAPLAPLPEGVRVAGGVILRLGAVGLALASGMTAWVELALLRRRLTASVGQVRLGGGHLGRILLATAGAGAVALFGRPLVDHLHPVVALALVGGPSGLMYLTATTALGVPEARALVGGVTRRLSR